MKKRLGILFAIVLLIGLLAACGPDNANPGDNGNDHNTGEENGNNNNENNSGEEAEADMPEKIDKLKLWVNAEEKQEDAVKEITEKYTEETGIAVELVPVDMLEQVEKLDVEGPAGNGPDIIFQPHDRIGDLVIRGLVDSVDLGAVESDYTDTALEAIQYDGEYWGFPAVVDTYAMYYNKSLVDEPKTMEDIMNIAEQFTDASKDEYGFLMEAANFYFSYPF